jgi:hypothetical protein
MGARSPRGGQLATTRAATYGPTLWRVSEGLPVTARTALAASVMPAASEGDEEELGVVGDP